MSRNPFWNLFWYVYWMFVYSSLWILAFIFLRLRIVHCNRLFRKGGVIYAPNHVSFLDPPLMGLAAGRPLVYMAKRELFKGFFGLILRSVGTHPVERDGADMAAFRYALKVLKGGNAMVIFPEGTRSSDGKLQYGQPGIARIARRASVPIVPVYFHGTYEALSRHMKKIKCVPVRVVIGEPMTIEELNAYPDDKDGYQAIAEEIMRRIAILAREYNETDGTQKAG